MFIELPQRLMAPALIGMLGLASAACTHLDTRPTGEIPSVDGGALPAAGAQRGLSYALPMVQYDLKITRALEKCPTGDSPPEITAKVSASERYVAGERFEVDYGALASIMKTTNFEVEYHEAGTLKTINASAEDKTGPVLTDVARIGLSIASATAGAPIPLTADNISNMRQLNQNYIAVLNERKSTVPNSKPTTIRLRCTKAASDALDALKAETKTVGDLTAAIAVLTTELDRLSELAALRVLSPEKKTRLATLVEELGTTETALRDSKAKLAAAEAALSATEEPSWPIRTAGTAAHSDVLEPSAQSLNKLWSLFELAADDGALPSGSDERQVRIACPTADRLKPAIDCLSEITSLNVALLPVSVQPASMEVRRSSVEAEYARNRAIKHAIVAPTNRRWAKGVFVREPAEARLVICRAPGIPVESGCDDPKTKVLRDKIVVAPQLGRLRLLPFTNGPFEDNELKLSIRANGLVETFRYGEESSAAGAASSLATISEKVESALEKMETERRDDVKYARETQAWVRTEAAAVRAEELAELTFEVDKLKKQSERLTAEMALAAGTDSAHLAAEQARIDAEVKLLQSRIARLKAAAEFASLSPPED